MTRKSPTAATPPALDGETVRDSTPAPARAKAPRATRKRPSRCIRTPPIHWRPGANAAPNTPSYAIRAGPPSILPRFLRRSLVRLGLAYLSVTAHNVASASQRDCRLGLGTP